MKIVVFGLTISSSWGNGHATLWRGLCAGLAKRGVHTVFFEREVDYYAKTRDQIEFKGCELILYERWDEIRPAVRRHLADADAVIVTSYCPDAKQATRELESSRACVKIFYDLDTPVTLSHIERGAPPDYIPENGLRSFDLALSFTGGAALTLLQERLGATRTLPLYGHVDPDTYRPSLPIPAFAADLSYIGTYAQDRQDALQRLFIDAARTNPDRRFVIAGAQYPQDFPWTANTFFLRHLPPDDHPSFYASSRMTLNVTRRAMAEMGWCPSGRLFEAAACGTPVLSDHWNGLSSFFRPGEEILIVDTTDDVCAALDLGPAELQRIGTRARDRVCGEHTSDHRATELLTALEQGRSSQRLNADIMEA